MTDYTGLKRLVDAAKPWVGTYAEWPETKGGKAMKNFCAAFKPKDADALIAENESFHKHWQNESNNVQAAVAEVVRLTAENEALRKDAERYRWLRQNEFDIGSFHDAHEHNHSAWFEHISSDDIDSSIRDENEFAVESGH